MRHVMCTVYKYKYVYKQARVRVRVSNIRPQIIIKCLDQGILDPWIPRHSFFLKSQYKP